MFATTVAFVRLLCLVGLVMSEISVPSRSEFCGHHGVRETAVSVRTCYF